MVLRNPVFLQVKGALEKNYIAVEDSFASSVSSIWKVALGVFIGPRHSRG